MNFPGVDGFLGTRASIMLDIVFVAMFAILPVLGWSVWQVKYRRRFALHKRVQLALLALLGVAVGLFEIDMRFISGWRERAVPSPYYQSLPTAGPAWDALCLDLLGMNQVPGALFRALAIHLVFAVSTSVLWIWVAVRAVKRFPQPPAPGAHSRSHIFWGRLAAGDMVLTATTGWIFYWLAFVA